MGPVALVSPAVEIVRRRTLTVSYFPAPDFGTGSPGPGEVELAWMDMHEENCERSDVWLFRGALQGEGVLLDGH